MSGTAVDLPSRVTRLFERERRTAVPVLSFFTGAGFLDIGFIQAGFDLVWHNEFHPAFAGAFQHGFLTLTGQEVQQERLNTGSIVDLEARQILQQAFGTGGRPDLFGIIGGPPCPDFSSAGKHRGSNGDNGKLTHVYLQRILELKPVFFVFENVPGLIITKMHRAFFASMIQLLESEYVVDVNLLNALDYGVPQDRERVFMVGFRREWWQRERGCEIPPPTLGWDPLLEALAYRTAPQTQVLGTNEWFPWDVSRHYTDAKTQFNWPGRSPFGSQPDKPQDIPQELMVGPLICDDEAATLPNGDEHFLPHSDKFWWVDEGDVSGKSFKRLHRWRYSPAVAYGNNEVHLHPTHARRLTVREALRLQTVPDRYALPCNMTLTAKFKTTGNGVPVRLAQAIADACLQMLQRP
jgi:DNA (cytosine-5)-methyltransferase 1